MKIAENINSIKPTLLVLAAGIASRYGSLKQIDSIGPCGETIIDYSIHDAMKAGFGKIVFVINRDIEKDFKEVILSKFENLIHVEYVFQEIKNMSNGIYISSKRNKPLGTGHAILTASETIHEPFAVINADDFMVPMHTEKCLHIFHQQKMLIIKLMNMQWLVIYYSTLCRNMELYRAAFVNLIKILFYRK